MEHRWGERFAVHMTVGLYSGSSPPVAGTLENVSASGAFVRTDGRGPPRGPVALILRQEASDHVRSVRLAAFVVRETGSGVGIEWCQFAPRAVRELVLPSESAGPTQARAQRARSTRRPSRESNTILPAHTQAASEPSVIRTPT
jgi:hypothetical protein